MTLRGLLRITRDAGLKERVGLTSEDVKKVRLTTPKQHHDNKDPFLVCKSGRGNVDNPMRTLANNMSFSREGAFGRLETQCLRVLGSCSAHHFDRAVGIPHVR